MKTSYPFHVQPRSAFEYRAIALVWLTVLLTAVLISCALPSGRPALFSASALILMATVASLVTLALERHAGKH